MIVMEWVLSGRWRAAIIGVVIGLLLGWGYHWFASPAAAQDKLAELVPLCGEWLETLRNNPNERVIFTGHDEFGQKVKVLVHGQEWRFIILAGAEDSKLGCEFLRGQGFMSR